MKVLSARRIGVLETLQIDYSLGTYTLRCGCRARLLRLRGSRIVAVIDEPHDDCRDRSHQVDSLLEEARSAALNA